MPGGEFFDQICRIIRRAIVHENDLILLFRIRQLFESSDAAQDACGFVPSGDDDTYARVALGHRMKVASKLGFAQDPIQGCEGNDIGASKRNQNSVHSSIEHICFFSVPGA